MATPLNPHNETLMDRGMLTTILNDLSKRILVIFGRPIRLVIHGGAVMILHPGLKSTRSSTRDVDFINRSFVTEMKQLGISDAEARLKHCITSTAKKFHLGLDWMNAHADVALPMATDPTSKRVYDPIYYASIKDNNVAMNTVFSAPGLTLIGVAWFWACALKMVRYAKHDPADISAILLHGTRLNGVQWTPTILEGWLLTECWAMGYANYPSFQMQAMREKIRHAVQQAYARISPNHHHYYPQPFQVQ